MNQFEFLRSIPFGQYLPVDSVLHRLDPRAKIIAYSLLVLALTFSLHIEGVLLGVMLVLQALWLGRIPLRYALRGLAAPLPFLLIIALLQVVWNNSPAGGAVLLAAGPIKITGADLMLGAVLLLRFTALILAIGLATDTLSTSEMISGLNKLFSPLSRVGIQAQDLVMMVQVTLRFLPLLAQSAERIAKAQAARGADWDRRKGNLLASMRRVIPLIVPLFLASLHRAEAMALAMDARAYGSAAPRSSLVDLHYKKVDFLFTAVGVLAAVGILFL
jgi:energy-coupling factor transport system permease protein